MSTHLKPLRALVLAALLAFPAVQADALTLADKTALQIAMQKHVDQLTIGDYYLYFDAKRGEVRKLRPATAHPMIMQMGKHFVLCFDFLDNAGKKVEVDYYMARKGRGFVVFHSAVASRNALMALVKSGKVRPAN